MSINAKNKSSLTRMGLMPDAILKYTLNRPQDRGMGP